MEDEDFDFSVMGPTGGFAVDGMEQSPLAGASLFDSAAESIRAARLGPMAQQAGGAYNQQAGALGSMVDRLAARRNASVSSLDKAYRSAQPSDSEKWLGIAAALLSPTETGKTTESIAKALGAYGQYQGRSREANAERSLALAKLAAQYDVAEGNLAAKFAAAQKPPRLAFDVAGNARDPYTGAVIEPPEQDIPVLTPEQVLSNPQITKWQTTDGRIMER